MVPSYSIWNFLAAIYYVHAVYFQAMAGAYAAIAIASFFALLNQYVAPDLHDQKEYFRSMPPKPWKIHLPFRSVNIPVWLGGKSQGLRAPRSGLTWYNVIRVVLGYLIKVTIS